MEPFYLAGFEKQLTGSAMGGRNCAAASGAMLADQSTMGLKNPTPDAFRKASGDFTGGLYMGQVATTLQRAYGVHTTCYDQSDGYVWSEMLAHLKQGRFMVVAGDYDQVPLALKGDKDFTGFHAVFYHRVGSEGVRVGDPLNDGRRVGIPKGYVWWPLDLARRYVERFDAQVAGSSLHAVVMDLKRLRARPVSPNTRIRQAPSRSSAVIGSFGGTTTVAWGGTVIGEAIGGNAVWYRVWWPAANSIGYCHSSVVAVV